MSNCKEPSLAFRDPNDEAILECAIRAGPAYLVTGDNDLLTMAHTETPTSVPASISRTRCDQRVDLHQQRYDRLEPQRLRSITDDKLPTIFIHLLIRDLRMQDPTT